MSKWKPVQAPTRAEHPVDTTADITNTQLSEAQDGGLDVQSPVEQPTSDPSPAPTLPTPPVVAAVLPDLDSLILNASPEQLAKLRMLAASQGVASITNSPSATKRADGTMMIEIALEAPIVEQLEIWAEADGISLAEEAQKRILEALQNYLYGDWSATIVEPAAVAEPAAK